MMTIGLLRRGSVTFPLFSFTITITRRKKQAKSRRIAQQLRNEQLLEEARANRDKVAMFRGPM